MSQGTIVQAQVDPVSSELLVEYSSSKTKEVYWIQHMWHNLIQEPGNEDVLKKCIGFIKDNLTGSSEQFLTVKRQNKYTIIQMYHTENYLNGGGKKQLQAPATAILYTEVTFL